MASRHPSKHCKLLVRIDQVDEEFGEMLRKLCLTGQLIPRRGRGVTFVMPTKEQRKKMVDGGYSADGPEQTILAVEAHILPFFLPAGGDFGKGELGSRAGVQLKVTKATAGEVTLEGGAVLKPDKKYVPLPRGRGESAEEPRTAMWEVCKGEMPSTPDGFDVRGALKAAKGAAGGGEASAKERRAKTLQLLRQGVADLGGEEPGQRHQSSLAVHVASFLTFLHDNRRRFPDDYQRALAVLDRSPLVSFVLLFEPFSQGYDYYISTEAAAAWGGAVAASPNHAQALLGFFEDLSKFGDPAALVYSSPAAAAAAAAELRDELLSDFSAITPSKMVETYHKTLADNALPGGAGPLWPACVAEKKANGRGLWQDAVRYSLHMYEAASQHHSVAGEDLVENLESFLRVGFPGDDFSGEVKTGFTPCKANLNDGTKVDICYEFLRTLDWMYLPMDTKLAASQGGSDPYAAESAGGSAWNPAKTGHLLLERIAGRADGHKSGLHTDSLKAAA